MSPASCRGEIVHVRVILYFLLFYIKRSRVDPGNFPDDACREEERPRVLHLCDPLGNESADSRGGEKKKGARARSSGGAPAKVGWQKKCLLTCSERFSIWYEDVCRAHVTGDARKRRERKNFSSFRAA